MKVFKVVETCTISWRDPINRANDLVLYPGEYNVRDWKEFCPNKLEDVSISWEREKLNKLLINDN
jgi:hypothetical protein